MIGMRAGPRQRLGPRRPGAGGRGCAKARGSIGGAPEPYKRAEFRFTAFGAVLSLSPPWWAVHPAGSAPRAPVRTRVAAPQQVGRAVLAGVLCAACAGAPLPCRAAVDAGVWVTNGGVSSIVADGTTLFVGGGFTRVGLETGSGVPISTSTFSPPAAFPHVVGNVTAVAPDGAGGWYLGGAFTSVGGLPRQNLAHLTSALAVDGWHPSVDALVLAIAVTPADVIIGGTFTTVNGLARPRLARLSRASGQPSAWTPAPDDRVASLASDGVTLYVGGSFASIAQAARAGLAAFTLSGDALTAWDPGATSVAPALEVDAVVLANGLVYVGGTFDHIGGEARAGAAALRPGNATATRWNPSPGFPFAVTRIAPIGDRVVLGADFTTAGLG